MSDTITFDKPQRVAVVYEAFEDCEGDSVEVGEWVQQRDTLSVTHIHQQDLSTAFENRETYDCLVVSSENLISAWTEGVTD